MGREATNDEINEILPWLGRDATDRIQSKAGRLIHSLQARALCDARALAAELTRDLDLFGTSDTRSAISAVCDLLRSDAVFSNCDRLSYLLLDLEQTLGVSASSASEVEISHKPAQSLQSAAVTHLQVQRAHEG